MDFFHEATGHEPGDPAKAAREIIAVINDENPPLLLLLGRDAVQVTRQLDAVDLAEIERWEQLCTSIDFAGLTPQVESESAFQAMLNPA
jgi:hypothetical protein